MRTVCIFIALAVVAPFRGTATVVDTNLAITSDRDLVLSQEPGAARDFVELLPSGVGADRPRVNLQATIRTANGYLVDGYACAARAELGGSAVKGIKTDFISEITVLDNASQAEFGSGNVRVRTRTNASGYATAFFGASRLGNLIDPPPSASGYSFAATIRVTVRGGRAIDLVALECWLTQYLMPDNQEYILSLVDDRFWVATDWWLDGERRGAMPERTSDTMGQFSFGDEGVPEITVGLYDECKNYDSWGLIVSSDYEEENLRAGIRYVFEILDRRTGRREVLCNTGSKTPIRNCRQLSEEDGYAYYANLKAFFCP